MHIRLPLPHAETTCRQLGHQLGRQLDRTERLDWIDAAKGFGILLVVIGHTVGGGAAYDLIYLFHMPMFFMLSGVVFRPEPTAALARKRARTLLLPYVSFFVLLLAAEAVARRLGGAPLASLAAFGRHQAKLGLLGGQALTGRYGTFWFVPCLFLGVVGYNALRRWAGGPFGRAMAWAAAGLLLAGYGLARLALPWDAAVAPMAVCFIWAGEAWGRVFRAGSARADGPWLAAACAVAALGVAYARPFDMKYGEYGTPVLSVAAALAWAHVVFVLSGWLARIEALRRVVAPLGRASLVILFLHRLIVLELHGLPDAVVVAAATGLPFLAWLAIRRCPSPLRQALLGERPSRVAGLVR